MIPSPIPLGHRLTRVLATGAHPSTLAPILPDAHCGQCALLQTRTRADGTMRTKCAAAKPPRGGPNLPPATPACAWFTPIPLF
jgi:hypothetical protein